MGAFRQLVIGRSNLGCAPEGDIRTMQDRGNSHGGGIISNSHAISGMGDPDVSDANARALYRTGVASSASTMASGCSHKIEIAESPFTKAVGLPRLRAHWVRPEIVVQIAFIEWTVHGKLRHGRFLGIREDKTAREVVREAP
jgi:hypothetical protein